ncbi:MAG: helix-turn-helix transcriptional regulator [Deltaproteobacteria bacterium]|nr:helix-turn-helix transcriptional regulator [Deltaproteobacteria bacterium]
MLVHEHGKCFLSIHIGPLYDGEMVNSEKSLIYDNIFMTSNNRLKLLRKSIKLTQKEFAERVCLKWYQIKDMEVGKVKIDSNTAKMFYHEFNANPDWLLTGKGEMFLTSPPSHVNEETPQYRANSDGQSISSSSTLPELLKKTADILQSSTTYRTALASNINAFHQALTCEHEIDDLKKDVGTLRNEVNTLRARLLKDEKSSAKE